MLILEQLIRNLLSLIDLRQLLAILTAHFLFFILFLCDGLALGEEVSFLFHLRGGGLGR